MPTYPVGNDPRHTPRPQLTYGRGAKNVTITGGRFITSSSGVYIQKINVGSAATSSTHTEHRELLHLGEKEKTLPRDIHILHAPQGNLNIHGGDHILGGGGIVVEYIGLDPDQNDDKATSPEGFPGELLDTESRHQAGNTDTGNKRQKQYAASNSAAPPPYHGHPAILARSTLLSNAGGNVNILEHSQIFGTAGSVTTIVHSPAASRSDSSDSGLHASVPIVHRAASPVPHDANIDMLPDLTGTTNLNAVFVVAAGPVKDISFVQGEDSGVNGTENSPC